MPRLSPIALALLLVACAAPPPPEPAASEPAVRLAVDVGVVVTDMDAALAFYREGLGLEQIGNFRTSLIGAGRMVQLRHGASIIKLVQMDEAPQQASPPGLTGGRGFRYITLMVDDISAMAERSAQAEAPVALPLTTLGNGAQILMVEDPEGNIVEFVQEPTG
ncbi:MAG: VOC family protein [Bacteroidota bacterium]